MCYNCGCEMKDDNMGDRRNITLADLARDALSKKKDGQKYLKDFSMWIDSLDTAELDRKIVEIKNSDHAKDLSSVVIDLARMAKAAIASKMNAQDTIEETVKLLNQTSAGELDKKIAEENQIH